MIIKKIKSLTKYFIFSVFIFFAFSASAQILEDPAKIYEQSEKLRQTVGFSDPVAGNTGNIGNIAELIIKAFLSLLAVIFIILIILAGYNWMTAAGDESKVSYAKETLKRAIIGLIIIASAYAITAFIFQNLAMGTSNAVSTYGGGME